MQVLRFSAEELNKELITSSFKRLTYCPNSLLTHSTIIPRDDDSYIGSKFLFRIISPMEQQLPLNIFLFGYLFLVMLENRFRQYGLSIILMRNWSQSVPLWRVIFVIFSELVIVSLLAIRMSNDVITFLLISIFSLTVFEHILWIGRNFEDKGYALFFLMGLALVISRILFPTVLFHDLFIVVSIAWLGPLISSFSFFSKKTFMIVSMVWFMYDLTYVWLTPSYKYVALLSSGVKFPLSVTVMDNSLGLADLFWASIFISIIDKNRRIQAVFCLVLSNLLLGYFAVYVFNIEVFPLLVLWVPLGLLFLALEGRKAEYL